jgi:hypothetical protein
VAQPASGHPRYSVRHARCRFADRWAAKVLLIGCLIAGMVLCGTTTSGAVSKAKVATTTDASIGGMGGFGSQRRIVVAPGTISPSHPLRVMLIGDSVMADAELGVAQALSATGEATPFNNTMIAFGLTTHPDWPVEFPYLIRTEHPQLIAGTWSWDFGGATTPNALHQPKRYAALMERFLRTLLTPGDGVDGVMLLEFPPIGVVAGATRAVLTHDKAEAEGSDAWDAIAERMPAAFPGKVMYLPWAGSILLDGHYSTWLPPLGDPRAPKAQWVRVRKLDDTHLCPQGSARLGLAITEDLKMLIGLASPRGLWFEGPWTTNPEFNDPPGACPVDHPPTRGRSAVGCRGRTLWGSLRPLLIVASVMGIRPASPARHRLSTTQVAQPRANSDQAGERQP